MLHLTQICNNSGPISCVKKIFPRKFFLQQTKREKKSKMDNQTESPDEEMVILPKKNVPKSGPVVHSPKNVTPSPANKKTISKSLSDFQPTLILDENENLDDFPEKLATTKSSNSMEFEIPGLFSLFIRKNEKISFFSTHKKMRQLKLMICFRFPKILPSWALHFQKKAKTIRKTKKMEIPRKHHR